MKDKIRKARKNYKMGAISYLAYMSQLLFILWDHGKGKRINRFHREMLEVA